MSTPAKPFIEIPTQVNLPSIMRAVDGGSPLDSMEINGENLVNGTEMQVAQNSEINGSDRVGKKEEKEEKEKEKEKEKDNINNALNSEQHCHYYFPLLEDRSGFRVNDLVWGKVKSHRWYPGQIFDANFATEFALSRERKDHFLVAFADKTFAWCHESQLKHFTKFFAQMEKEKQSSMVSIGNAVNAVLKEVTRRVEFGMACHCLLSDPTFSSLSCQKVENAGIKEGTCFPEVDHKSVVVNSFQPESLLDYIQTLARCPFGGVDRLELAVAKGQVKSFYRHLGHLQLPVFDTDGGLVRNESEILLSKSKISEKCGGGASNVTSGKKPRGRPRKNIVFVDHVQCLGNVDETEYDVQPISAISMSEIYENGISDSSVLVASNNMPVKKQRGRPHKYPLIRKDSDTPMISLLKEMEELPPVLKSNEEIDETSVGRRKQGCIQFSPEEYSSPSEILSQLYLVSKDPTEVYDFIPMLTSFFIDFRESLNSEGEKIGQKGKSVRCKKHVSSETPDPDYIPDSYWSDIVLNNSPESQPASRGVKRKGDSQKKPPEKKPKSERLYLQLDQVDAANFNDKQEVDGEGTINHSMEEKEETPTSLILNFSESGPLPYAADLIKIFSPYGALREEETEVLPKTSRARVVFKYRDDAEKAFSSACKYSVFGAALVSYRLRYSPSSKSSSKTLLPPKHATIVNNGNLGQQAQEGNGADNT